MSASDIEFEDIPQLSKDDSAWDFKAAAKVGNQKARKELRKREDLSSSSHSEKKFRFKWRRKTPPLGYESLVPNRLKNVLSLATSLMLIFLDLAFCVIYIVERQSIPPDAHPPFYLSPRPLWIRWVLLALSIFFFAVYVSRLRYMKLAHFLSFATVVDLITLIPVFAIISEDPIGGSIFFPYFMRCWSVIPQIQYFVQLQGIKEGFTYDPFGEKILSLLVSLLSFVFTFACFFQWAESSFAGYMNLWDAVYFVVVTMATVGYGDVTPTSYISQLVVILLIACIFLFLPDQIGQLLEAFKIRRERGGNYNDRSWLFWLKKRHVVVCGNFEHGSLIADVLNDFFPEIRGTMSNLHLVFLTKSEPSPSMKLLLQTPPYKSMTSYLIGNATNIGDLKRASLKTAEACFVLAGHHDGDLFEADMRHIFRVMSIQGQCPHVPIFSYSLKAPTTLQLKHVAQVRISNQLVKMTLLACNSLHRLAIPFICNLFRQTQPFKNFNEPWMDQYGDGSGNEMYEKKVMPQFVGKSFSHAAAEYLIKSQVILLGVVTRHNGEDHVMLNPSDWLFLEEDICMFIAQDYASIEQTADIEESIEECLVQVNSSLSYPKLISPGKNQRSSFLEHWDEITYVGYPPNPFKDSDPPCCHLHKEPVALSDIVVRDASRMKGHLIAVITTLFPIGIFPFLSVLRAAHLTKDELSEILVVVQEVPEEGDWEYLARFPGIKCIQADCTKDQDLPRIGLSTCQQVVIFSDIRDWVKYPKETAMVDAKAVLIFQKMRAIAGEQIPLTAELVYRNNWKYVPPFSQSAEYGSLVGSSYLLTPSYVAGNVLSPNLIECLLYQTFFDRPHLVPFVNLLTGWRSQTVSYRKIEEELNVKCSHLAVIDVPDGLFGNQETATFGYVFLYLLKNFNILTLAILREKNKALKNSFPFIYTNPLPSTPVIPKDRLFVLLRRDTPKVETTVIAEEQS